MSTTSSAGVNDAALQSPNTEVAPQVVKIDAEVLDAITEVAAAIASESSDLSEGNVVIVVSAEDLSLTPAMGLIAPVEPPLIDDGQHPAFSLVVDGDLISTAGGYGIEVLEQYAWKIIGPNDAYTIISDNPNVAESDGGTWNFNNDSTFVLGDGTRINVMVVALENGVTVTSQLEIICGVDCVVVTGIDEGKGQIGPVTQDGLERAEDFLAEYLFSEGSSTDIWLYLNDEIVGNYRDGGFRLHDAQLRYLASFFKNFLRFWEETWQPNRFGSNPYCEQEYPSWQTKVEPERERRDDYNRKRIEREYELKRLNLNYDRQKHLDILKECFQAFAIAHDSCRSFLLMNEQLSTLRHRSLEV